MASNANFISQFVMGGDPCTYKESGELQAEMSKLTQLKSDPDWRNRSGSILKKQYARRDILKNRVWERSPSIKSVSVELKTEAIRRMKHRKVVGEKVQDIADDLNVSISRLYHWLKM
ncbi:TPA: hypothetical protein ACUQAX_000114 [Escherichia coli]